MASKIKDLQRLTEKLESKVKNLEANIIIYEESKNNLIKEINILNNSIQDSNIQLVSIRENISNSEVIKKNIDIDIVKWHQNITKNEQILKSIKENIILSSKDFRDKKSLLDQVIIFLNKYSINKEELLEDINTTRGILEQLKLEENIINNKIWELKNETIKYEEYLKNIKKEYTNIEKNIWEIEEQERRIIRRESEIILKEQRYNKIRFKK